MHSDAIPPINTRLLERQHAINNRQASSSTWRSCWALSRFSAIIQKLTVTQMPTSGNDFESIINFICERPQSLYFTSAGKRRSKAKGSLTLEWQCFWRRNRGRRRHVILFTHQNCSKQRFSCYDLSMPCLLCRYVKERTILLRYMTVSAKVWMQGQFYQLSAESTDLGHLSTGR